MTFWLKTALGLIVALAIAAPAAAQAPAPSGGPTDPSRTVDVGKTGWAAKRPVMAAACPNTCPWGELGDFVKTAMAPKGYEVILCRNCNRTEGPRVVGKASLPPPLIGQDLLIGSTTRVNAPIDFGVTESGILNAAYLGTGPFAQDGAYKNLRLIAKIEDPTYLLIAVKASLGVTSLAEVRDRKLPVKIMSTGGTAQEVLDHFGLTREAVTSWGGSYGNPMGAPATTEFDIVASNLASPAQNIESSYWTAFTQKHDLKFLDIPEELLAKFAATGEVERVSAKYGLLRGVDRIIPTVGRSGEAIFARADTPDQAAYELAKAIDEQRGQLRWFIRPYSYESRTVTKNFDVPLHPGAARYYRQAGYLKEPARR